MKIESSKLYELIHHKNELYYRLTHTDNLQNTTISWRRFGDINHHIDENKSKTLEREYSKLKSL